MESKQYGERTVDSVQIGLRVPKPLRDQIRDRARENGRAMTAEFEALIADGLTFQRITGDKSRALIELLGAWIGGANDTFRVSAVLHVLKRHVDWHVLFNAMMNLDREHTEEKEAE